jgi:hypothetical protein
MYGMDRLEQKSLTLGKSQTAGELGQVLKHNLHDFLNDGEFTDDFTLVIVAVEG